MAILMRLYGGGSTVFALFQLHEHLLPHSTRAAPSRRALISKVHDSDNNVREPDTTLGIPERNATPALASSTAIKVALAAFSPRQFISEITVRQALREFLQFCSGPILSPLSLLKNPYFIGLFRRSKRKRVRKCEKTYSYPYQSTSCLEFRSVSSGPRVSLTNSLQRIQNEEAPAERGFRG
jgi:hypothetical protein